MAHEKLTPVSKPVSSSGGIKEGQSTLTTPKQETDGKAPWGKEAKGSILK